VSIVKFDDTRFNVMCSVFASVPDVPSPTVTVTAVSGIGRANNSDVVSKYGGRTQFTTGRVTLVVGEPEGRGLKIVPSTFPQFADGSPISVMVGGSPRISPANEPGWFDAIVTTSLTNRIRALNNPQASPVRHYNATEALAIFNQLWSMGRILGVFSAPGDSGSWILRGTQVVGIMNSGDWVENTSTTVSIMGLPWGTFTKETYGYDFATALNFINARFAADPAQRGVQLQLCIEASRSRPTPGDCSTALVGNSCRWPRSCQLAGASCSPRGPMGI